jgi:hypothetical protein
MASFRSSFLRDAGVGGIGGAHSLGMDDESYADDEEEDELGDDDDDDDIEL